MHGSAAGQAEDSIFLRGAQVFRYGKELQVIKDGELTIAMFFDHDEEAELWGNGLSSALRVSDSLPKLFSVAKRSEASQVSKLLSLKRKELHEVEQKAHSYELVADQRQQQVHELQQRLATAELIASEKDQEMERLRQRCDMELSTPSAEGESRLQQREKKKMEEVQKRLLAMQKLLEQSDPPRKPRRSTPASFPG